MTCIRPDIDAILDRLENWPTSSYLPTFRADLRVLVEYVAALEAIHNAVAEVTAERDLLQEARADLHKALRLYRSIADENGCPDDESQFAWLRDTIQRVAVLEAALLNYWEHATCPCGARRESSGGHTFWIHKTARTA